MAHDRIIAAGLKAVASAIDEGTVESLRRLKNDLVGQNWDAVDVNRALNAFNREVQVSRALALGNAAKVLASLGATRTEGSNAVCKVVHAVRTSTVD